MSQRVLVLNAGSSSLKFKLFDSQNSKILAPAASGLIEQIGTPARSAITAHEHHDVTTTTHKQQHRVAIENYTQALDLVLGFLKDTFTPAVVQQVAAVGHRVVHGKAISAPALITPPILDAIRDATDLAPLHNPPNLQGIEAAQRTFGHCPQVRLGGRQGGEGMQDHNTLLFALHHAYAIPTRLTLSASVNINGTQSISPDVYTLHPPCVHPPPTFAYTLHPRLHTPCTHVCIHPARTRSTATGSGL